MPAREARARGRSRSTLEFRATEDKPRQTPALRAARPGPPASAHPQMRTEDDAALNCSTRFLPTAVDRFDMRPSSFLGRDRRLQPGMRCLHLEPLTDEGLQPPSRPVEGVALGHSGPRTVRDAGTARRGPARSRPRREAASRLFSITGSPSNRSTARRSALPYPTRKATSAARAGRSHDSSGSRSGTSERPPRST